jgi:hypothetical protein
MSAGIVASLFFATNADGKNKTIINNDKNMKDNKKQMRTTTKKNDLQTVNVRNCLSSVMPLFQKTKKKIRKNKMWNQKTKHATNKQLFTDKPIQKRLTQEIAKIDYYQNEVLPK